jgi:hypothetical protein
VRPVFPSALGILGLKTHFAKTGATEMKKLVALSLGLCLSAGSFIVAFAQESSEQVMQPPNVFVIQREFVKPGRSGSTHEKSESAFVQAMTAAKWSTHYFAADSLSGPTRSLFFIGYDSFAAWEKDNQATAANATLSAAVDKAALADGDLLTEYDTGVFIYREDLSLHAPVNIARMRYFEISRFVVRPGHGEEWETLVHEYAEAFGKAVPDAHFAMFESVYGAENGGVFLAITPMKSLAQTDRSFADSKKMAAGLGESGMKKIEDLEASCVESVQTNLFIFNPKMSYPADSWIKADPDFWSPK